MLMRMVPQNSNMDMVISDYFSKFTDEYCRWDFAERLADFDEDPTSDDFFINNRPQQTVQCLKRDQISVYGSNPKMEDRVYSICGVCEQVFNPHTVSNHQDHCNGKGKTQSLFLKKKIKTKKKLQSTSVPPPPLFKKDNGPPVLSRIMESPRITPEVLPFPEPTTININVTISSTPKLANEIVETLPSPPPSPPHPLSPIILQDDDAPNSNRYKKSKKSAKIPKEYEADVQSGVSESKKGPSTRSITCSNHKVQLRKSAPGRSKDNHQVVAERKAVKEKDIKRRSPSRLVIVEPKPSSSNYYTNETPIQIKSDGGDGDFATTTRVPLIPSLSDNDMHDDGEIEDSNQLESGYCSIETTVSSHNRSPTLTYYKPISPIYVLTPMQNNLWQIVQKENNIYMELQEEEEEVEDIEMDVKVKIETPPPELSPGLPNGSYFLAIPEPTTNIKLYKSHPKPAIVASYGSRKIGGAILSSNQRLEYQRNDIQMAINTKRRPTSTSGCKAASYNVPPQRSILLKTANNNKGVNRVNCKRTSTDKLSVSDNNKQIKLGGDVNGFILHTDMSEFAEAPHNCIQENINLLNMK